MRLTNILKVLGPGLLYAGAAIGVSHLVQSTRAGASYEFDLVWVLILANILKYPFFEFGPRYAIATNNSLIDGYLRTGKWAVWLFTLLTVATMFAILGAVTMVTAGITKYIFNSSLSIAAISAIILGTTMVILMIGHYAVLDKLIKIVIIILVVSTILAVVSAFQSQAATLPEHIISFDWKNKAHIIFLIAFVGWMPAPIDVSVWQSLWTVAKTRNLGYKPTMKEALVDFKTGYIGTAFMALCFLSLGALVMYGTGEKLSPNGVVFTDQLISLYTRSIGDWAYFVIAIAASTIMFSTTLTCIDAYPRVLRPLTRFYFPAIHKKLYSRQILYWFWIMIMAGGAMILIGYLASSMHFMVDMATTLSFITAPVLAYLNYRAVTGKHVPAYFQPRPWLKIYAWTGILFLTAFTVFYLVWRFAG